MRIRLPYFLLLLTGVALFVCVLQNRALTRAELRLQSEPNLACGTSIALEAAIDKLSLENEPETAQIRKALVQQSNKSQTCRTETIKALVQAMDQPNLNFFTDRRSFILWSNGSAILGELKAVESLDLLIEHLHLNDGAFSASMAHQPAFRGVTQMGELAVPKLSIALQQNKSESVRRASVLCLVAIGGSTAIKALELTLPSERNPCVRDLIETAVEILNKESSLKGQPSNQAEEDKLLDLRRELLVSYRCRS